MCHNIIKHSFNENIKEFECLLISYWNGKLKFSTHFPHSAFSTPRIFHTPPFPHSALRTPRFPPNRDLFDVSLRSVVLSQRWYALEHSKPVQKPDRAQFPKAWKRTMHAKITSSCGTLMFKWNFYFYRKCRQEIGHSWWLFQTVL